MRLQKEEADEILECVRACFKVLRTRDKVPLTDRQIDERARNTAFQLYGLIDEILEKRE